MADFVFEGVALGLVVLGLGVLLGLAEALDDGNALPRLVIASPPRLTATPATTMAAIRLTSTPAIHHAPGCCRFASERAAGFDDATPLFGALPELDSMAVATLLTELEDRLGITIDDDEVDVEMFETFGALVAFARAKALG